MADRSILTRLASHAESPPVWLAFFVGLAWLQNRYLPLLDPGRTGVWVGTALILAGAVLMAVSLAQFARARTTVIPRERPTAMITTGVYRLSRNPIYLADAMVLTGVALIWDALALLLVPLFMALIEVRFIRGEEAGLRSLFGAEFDAFAARTRRWL